MTLKKIIKKCQRYFSSNAKSNVAPRYLSLTPTDGADENGCYANALLYALGKDDILNIAVTGPYGSGKSSVIKSFEKKYSSNFNYLNISLAAFFTKKDTDINIGLIEQSILQQILYKEDRDSLPLSNLRRLSESKKIRLIAYLFPVWVISILIVTAALPAINNLNTIVDNYYFVVWAISTISISGIVLISIDLFRYIAQRQVSIDFKTNIGGIKIGSDTEQSVLNKNLDEILYFFSKTDYRVVVIEDLDRFENTEIFVKLREINFLINQSKNVTSSIKFIYAIKDEFFIHNDRTKFFDFIIPIVPIINSSNSYEKLKEHLGNSLARGNVNEQFIKDVSIYISDLRLLSNIINEMNIYYEHFDKLKTNLSKLLAIIIYKNIFPDDFTKLNNNDGVVYSIVKNRTKEILIQRSRIDDQITKLKDKLKTINENNLSSIDELKRIYLSRLTEIVVEHQGLEVYVDNSRYPIKSLIDDEIFDRLCKETNISYQNIRNQRGHLGIAFLSIENDINDKLRYSERKEKLLLVFDEANSVINEDIKKLLKNKSKLGTITLAGLIKSNPDMLLDTKDLDNEYRSSELLRLLLSDGWIDEHYQDYIARFYEGSLTTDDMNFIRSIRDSVSVEYSFTLSNIKEVIYNLRQDDFKGYLIYNYNLIDYIVENASSYKVELSLLSDNLLEHPKELSLFIEDYFSVSDKASKFIISLLLIKPDLSYEIIKSKSLNASIKDTLIRHAILNLENEELLEKLNISNTLTSFISNNPAVIMNSMEDNRGRLYKYLSTLKVRIKDLSLITEDKLLLQYMYEKSLYYINSKNINTILRTFNKDNELNAGTSNLTTINASGCEYMIDYIGFNLDDYLDEVFLELDTNTGETSDTIVALYNNETISLEKKKLILGKQDWIIESIGMIPNELWEEALLLGKVKPNWENVFVYYNEIGGSKFDSTLVLFLNSPMVYTALSENVIADVQFTKEVLESMSHEIIFNCEISIDAFEHLVRSVPYNYDSLGDTILPAERISSLLVNKKLNLTNITFEYVRANNPENLARLLKNNIKTLLEKYDEYDIKDSKALLLLRSDISESEKSGLLGLFDEGFYSNKDIAIEATKILLKQEKMHGGFSRQSLMNLLQSNINDLDSTIKVITKYSNLLDNSDLTNIFSMMQGPYLFLKADRKQPLLENTATNVELLKALESKRYISSWKQDGKKLRVFLKSKDV